jgi:hypothetical protein
MNSGTGNSRVLCAASAALVFTLVGCGGGGSDDASTPLAEQATAEKFSRSTPTPDVTSSPTLVPPELVRAAAVAATAQSSSGPCAAIQPFYWEIGDKNSALASGSVNKEGEPTRYDANTVMPIASATKWIYGAYVAEKRAGVLTDSDIKFLNFRSGYVSFEAFGSCKFGDTVDGCLNNGNNGAYTASSDGKFDYDGGHMQKHASQEGLGGLSSIALGAEMRRVLGEDIALRFTQPQLAGGVATSAADYAVMLRKFLGGQLHMGKLLGTNAVCTNPSTCKAAVYTPTPKGEDWQYSVGHWVDADRSAGDGAFSSTGAFGFHPWIDATKTSYGVIARQTKIPGTGFDSAVCGRLLRKAWKTGKVQ